MSITFKTFAHLIIEGKRPYSSQSYWKGDAQEAGFKIKKLSGDLTKGDQTWGAFNDADEKVGEFTEKEDGRGGWLIDDSNVNEMFGVFRNNEKQKAERDKLKGKPTDATSREAQAKKNGQGKGNDVDPDEETEDDEPDDRKKKTTSATRSASTRGTKSTQSQASAKQSERDYADSTR